MGAKVHATTAVHKDQKTRRKSRRKQKVRKLLSLKRLLGEGLDSPDRERQKMD